MRSSERTALLTAAGALAGAPVLGVLLLAGLYQYGLRVLPERPRLDAPRVASPVLRAAVWARFGGTGTPQFAPMTVWGFVRLRACRFSGGAEGREACLRGHPGVALAEAVARQHARSLAVSADGLGAAATAGWLTRNASADLAIDSLLATRPWGHGWRDADDAARGYFGTPAAALTAAGAALLAAALTDEANRSRGVDPWCAPDEAAAARDRVLQRMAENGALTAAAAARLRASPLGVVARDCAGAALSESFGHRQETVDVGGGVEEGR